VRKRGSFCIKENVLTQDGRKASRIGGRDLKLYEKRKELTHQEKEKGERVFGPGRGGPILPGLHQKKEGETTISGGSIGNESPGEGKDSAFVLKV